MKNENRRANFFNRGFESKMKMRKFVKNFFVLAALIFSTRNYVAFAEDLHDKLPDNFDMKSFSQFRQFCSRSGTPFGNAARKRNSSNISERFA